MELSRRAVLSGASAIGASTLAGCGNTGDVDEDCESVPEEPNYAGWFDDTSNYRHTCDRREQDRASVTVGARGNSGYYAFSPAAVAVTTGTTVEWRWSGRGGAHDVEEARGVFDSGRPVDEEDETFERTFDRPGVFRYVCNPHETHGMRGAVFVALE